MNPIQAAGFHQGWAVDFEFSISPGDRPDPICLVARELISGETIRVFGEDLRRMSRPPYDAGPDSVVVAYYASAEVGCHLALEWPPPVHLLDLFAEFRNLTNGKNTSGAGLLDALGYCGLDSIGAETKTEMRALALRGGPWTEKERTALLDYCESDVLAVGRLFGALAPRIDIGRALLRGRYMCAAASMEHQGIPMDTHSLVAFCTHLPTIRQRLIARTSETYQVYDGTSFRESRFAEWLRARGIPWPQTPTGRLALDDDTFRFMAQSHPELAQLRELRALLAQLRTFDLPVGKDGRNRCLLSAFRARTGRNQPSTTQFIFGLPSSLRGFVAPPPGRGLAYVDWSQQEFGIAAALSRDANMAGAYQSGDPYLTFAKQAGAVPHDATKRTHAREREQFKACALAVQYGMGEESLALRIGQSPAAARELLRLHRETYRRFWRWSDAALDYAAMFGELRTVFGWTLHCAGAPNSRSIRNFPMQANGAEMLRLACCHAVEAGIEVCAPVHDALLVEAAEDELDSVVTRTQAAMARASREVLDGFELRSDAKLVRHPERYDDERGRDMWHLLMAILVELEQEPRVDEVVCREDAGDGTNHAVS